MSQDILARNRLLRQGGAIQAPHKVPVGSMHTNSTMFRSVFACNSRRLTVILALVAGILAACDNTTYSGVEDTTDTPQGRFEPDVNDPNRQTIFGAGGINALFDEEREGDSGGGGGLGVNAFLWRASLDTFTFLPPLSADPLGGVIIYDWYAPPETPNERFKVTVFILDTRLRADGVRVAVNRQLRGADGNWYEAEVDGATPASLEDAILTRARQMRIAQLGQ